MMIDAVSELPPFQQSNGYISVFFSEQLELLQKQSYIRRQKDLLKQSLIRQFLVPYRCVLTQIGCENVVLHALPEYVSSIFDILSVSDTMIIVSHPYPLTNHPQNGRSG